MKPNKIWVKELCHFSLFWFIHYYRLLIHTLLQEKCKFRKNDNTHLLCNSYCRNSWTRRSGYSKQFSKSETYWVALKIFRLAWKDVFWQANGNNGNEMLMIPVKQIAPSCLIDSTTGPHIWLKSCSQEFRNWIFSSSKEVHIPTLLASDIDRSKTWTELVFLSLQLAVSSLV